MANKLTPPPPTGTVLDRWLALLYQLLTAAGQILWTQISKAGSNLTDIETRNHADLQNLNTASYTHLTAANHTDLTDAGDSALHYHATDRARANHTGTQAATTVLLDRIGASTYSTVQDLQNIFHSAGWVTDCAVTDNGDGTVAVGSGTGVIRATDSAVASIKFFDIGNTASVSLTNLSFNWVYIDYNAGTPVITASTTEPTEHNTKIKLAAIYRNGTELHINDKVRYEIGDHAANMVRQMQEVMPYAHVSGAEIAESGTRNINLTAGAFWNGLSRFTTAALNTAVSGTFSTFHRDGAGGWTETTGQTQVNNTNYDDGDGTLGSLSANRYTNRWVYLATDGDVHVIYGQAQHVLLTDAQTEAVPSSIPSELQTDSFLIGRIIVRQGVTTLVQIDSAFMQSFNIASVTDVSELSGLGTGVATFLATPSSANLAAAVTDETGSGALVFGTSPTVTGPTISSGDLTLSGLAQTITGDFSNSTVTNRVSFKTTTTNGNTTLSLRPDGTGATSQVSMFGASDQGNAPIGAFSMVGASDFRIQATKTGTASYREIKFFTSDTHALTIALTPAHVTPGADNTQNFGSGALRWKEIFAGNATINTSDAREKTPVRTLSAAELAVAKQLSSEIGIYQWMAAVAEKGDGARLHCGMTVQRAIEIFVANGLDPFRYGLVCYDEWAEKTSIEEVEAGDPDAVIDGTKQVQATETQTRHWQAIEIIDGVATLVARIEAFDAPVFDLLPVFDEAGTPVMKGEEQVMHQVPVMIDVPRYVKKTHTLAGNRYGFRGNELLMLIAAGFNARLTDLEQKP